MLPTYVKPLSSGSVFPWLTADRIVSTSSTSTLETPSSISTDQNVVTTGEITAAVVNTPNVQATTSAGILLESNSGTDIALMGAGGGAGVTFYGGVILDAETASRIVTTGASKDLDTPAAVSTAQDLTLTGTVSVVDGNFSIVGSSDTSKTLKFEVDAQSANADLTINTGAQTVDRTATFPVLTGNSILTLSNATLTSTRVPFATTNGILTDSAALTFGSQTLTVGDSTGQGTVSVKSATSTAAGFAFYQNNVLRAAPYVSSSAAFVIELYDSSGISTGNAVTIANAASGAMSVARLLSVNVANAALANTANFFSSGLTSGQNAYVSIGRSLTGNQGFYLNYAYNSTAASTYLSIQDNAVTPGTRSTFFWNSGGQSVGVATDAGIGAILAATHIRSQGPTSGIGYATGAGGTVAQGSGSGKATGVTLNTVCGTITMDGATLNADTTVAFTFTNSAIAATDQVVFTHSSVGTLGAYTFAVTPAGGSATVSVRNVTPGNLSEAIVIRFVVIKAVTS